MVSDDAVGTVANSGTVTFGIPAETLIHWPSCNSLVIVRDFNQN